MTIALIVAAAVAGSTPTASHATEIEHGGTRHAVAYHATHEIHHKQVGFAAGTRQGHARCQWTATIAVDREVAGATRRLEAQKRLGGSLPGDCHAQRRAIEREVAAREDEVRTHLAAVAEHDRSLVMAELAGGGTARLR